MGCCNSLQPNGEHIPKSKRISYSDFIRQSNETELHCSIASLDGILGTWRIGTSPASQTHGGVLTLELNATTISDNIVKEYRCIFHYGPPSGYPSNCYHYYKYSVGNWKIVNFIDKNTNQRHFSLRLIATKNSLLEYTDRRIGSVAETKKDIGFDFLGCDIFEKNKNSNDAKKEDLMFEFIPPDFEHLKQFIIPNCKVMINKKLPDIEWNEYGQCYLMLKSVLSEYDMDIKDIRNLIVDYIINIDLKKPDDADHWDSHDQFWKLEKANFSHEYFISK